MTLSRMDKKLRRKYGDIAGKLKVWQQRLASYVSMVNFAMIFYLYIIESPMGLQWYHWIMIIVIGVVSIVFIDVRYVLPNTLKYNFNKNPEMIQLKNQLGEIRKETNEIKKMLMEKE